jgi:hypothetical protein
VSSIFDLIALGVLGFFQWYAQEILNPQDLVLFLIRQLIMYVLLQLLLHLFPFLKRITNILWFPFRFVHVYLHVFTAKELYRALEEKEEEEDEDFDNLYDQHYLRTSLSTGLARPDEKAMLIVSFNRVGHALKVATAPSRFGWILLVGYLVITPLALVSPLSQAFLTVAGAALHFYFFVGIFGVMMPTLSDWMYVINTVILNLNIRPVFLFNAVLVMIIFTVDSFWRTQNFLIAVFVGLVMFIIYLWGLIMIAILALRGTLRNPELFFVPFKSMAHLHEKPAGTFDVEFYSEQDDEDHDWDD